MNRDRKLTKREQARLNKEAQVHKCLVCDTEKVKWNGECWQCEFCGFLYDGMLESHLLS